MHHLPSPPLPLIRLGLVLDGLIGLKWMDGVPLGSSVSRYSRWGHRWGQILSTQPVGVPSAQSSLGLPPVGIGSLV